MQATPRWGRALAAVALIWPGLIGAQPPPADPLVRLHYDAEVAAYCGLLSSAVQAGFQHQLRALMARSGATDEDLQQARMQAWQAAHLEWQNRGLGGFRGWCAVEGREAAAGFASE